MVSNVTRKAFGTCSNALFWFWAHSRVVKPQWEQNQGHSAIEFPPKETTSAMWMIHTQGITLHLRPFDSHICILGSAARGLPLRTREEWAWPWVVFYPRDSKPISNEHEANQLHSRNLRTFCEDQFWQSGCSSRSKFHSVRAKRRRISAYARLSPISKLHGP